MKTELTKSERSVRLDMFSDAEKAIYNAQQELEKVGAHQILTEASILLSRARQLVTDYLWKPVIKCDDFIFHYSDIDEPQIGDWILTFDAIDLHISQVRGESKLFGECYVSNKKSKDGKNYHFLTKSQSRKIIKVEVNHEKTDPYPKLDIVDDRSNEEVIEIILAL